MECRLAHVRWADQLRRRGHAPLAGAGLPQLAGLAGRSRLCAERRFTYTAGGPLAPDDAKEALGSGCAPEARTSPTTRWMSEKEYMRTLAQVGQGAHRSGDIADALGVRVRSVEPRRSGLIRKG